LTGLGYTAAFACPCCGATSPSPSDIEQRYCPACHWWTGDPALGPPHVEGPCAVREARKAATEARRAAHGWFGKPWESFVCYEEDGRLLEELRMAFLSGESCLLCGEQFDEAAGDSGKAMPCDGVIRHVHKECMLMDVIGSLAHHEGYCRCHGGDGRMPGMTVRQEALEVWKRLLAGTLYR
jgi:hypothetical protein